MMVSIKHYLLISNLFLFVLCENFLADELPCGDWEAYKDEKCYKVLDKVGTEVEAETMCGQQYIGSTLITIQTKEEQDFLTNLIFKVHKVVDSIWLGAKYITNKFKWVDNTELVFTNWEDGSPKNASDGECIQMISESTLMGKWTDEPCNKDNKIVCQKMQTWSLLFMQKTFIDARKMFTDSIDALKKQLKDQEEKITNDESSIDELKKQLKDQQSTISGDQANIDALKKQMTDLDSTIKSQQTNLDALKKQINDQQTTISNHQSNIDSLNKYPVPIGFIYVQLPQEKSPDEIWPSLTWSEVSDIYEGVFFRVSGGNSGSFGETQEENSPRLTQVGYDYKSGSCGSQSSFSVSPGSWSAWTGGCNINDIQFLVSSGEVRPKNMAVKIWKRTG